MAHPADPLIDLPHDERIRSRKLAGGVATIIADATGLSDSERNAFEEELRLAALKVPGVGDARIALTATYQIANRDGAKGPVLTSEPVKLKVVEK